MGMNGMLVTFIVIVAAGFGVLMGFAVTQYFYPVTPYRNVRDDVEGQLGQQNQLAYMSETRARNKQEIVRYYIPKVARQAVLRGSKDDRNSSQSKNLYAESCRALTGFANDVPENSNQAMGYENPHIVSSPLKSEDTPSRYRLWLAA